MSEIASLSSAVEYVSLVSSDGWVQTSLQFQFSRDPFLWILQISPQIFEIFKSLPGTCLSPFMPGKKRPHLLIGRLLFQVNWYSYFPSTLTFPLPLSINFCFPVKNRQSFIPHQLKQLGTEVGLSFPSSSFASLGFISLPPFPPSIPISLRVICFQRWKLRFLCTVACGSSRSARSPTSFFQLLGLETRISCSHLSFSLWMLHYILNELLTWLFGDQFAVSLSLLWSKACIFPHCNGEI